MSNLAIIFDMKCMAFVMTSIGRADVGQLDNFKFLGLVRAIICYVIVCYVKLGSIRLC